MAIKDPRTMLVLPTSGVVHSETTPGKTYNVQLPYCPCADFAYRRANKPLSEMFCKHLAAFAAAVGGYHAPGSDGFADMSHAVTRNLLTAADDVFAYTDRRADRLMEIARCVGSSALPGHPNQLTYDRDTQRYSVVLP